MLGINIVAFCESAAVTKDCGREKLLRGGSIDKGVQVVVFGSRETAKGSRP